MTTLLYYFLGVVYIYTLTRQLLHTDYTWGIWEDFHIEQHVCEVCVTK
jgi:uncharacterized membrane protein